MNKFKLVRAGIHVNEGIERLCGDEETYEKLLLTFPDDPHFEQLKKALEEQNVENAFAAAHALKGVVGNLAMNELYDAVFPLVETLRSGSLAVEEQMPAIEAAYEKAYAVTKAMKDNQ